MGVLLARLAAAAVACASAAAAMLTLLFRVHTQLASLAATEGCRALRRDTRHDWRRNFCLDELSGGDIDFDGTSYWPDWPTGTSPTATTPGSFVQSAPTSNGQNYPQSFFQTDVALSESTCAASFSGCTVPPSGPGNFYPYWSTINDGTTCSIVFGNVASGTGVNNFGGDAQYGADLRQMIGYDEFESPVTPAVC